MAAIFKPSTAKALYECGWVVGASSATRVSGAVRLRVTTTGQWFARIKGDLAASGTCADPAAAAMDAHEFAWAYRAQNQQKED